jgi:hypothetical protein
MSKGAEQQAKILIFGLKASYQSLPDTKIHLGGISLYFG